MTERLCIDCRHCQRPPRSDIYGTHLCVRPVGAVHSRVTGSVTRHLFARCAQERTGQRTIMGRLKCGEGARFFQADNRPPPPPPQRGG